MISRAWLLLVICLLMQVGSPGFASCRFGETTGVTAAGCVLDSCCCAAPGAVAPACACLEDPAGNDDPAPVRPSPTGAGRDLLPPVAWVERREGVRSVSRHGGPRALGWSRTGPSTRAVVPVALTVRYRVLLI